MAKQTTKKTTLHVHRWIIKYSDGELGSVLYATKPRIRVPDGIWIRVEVIES